ncbi:unnamed protein product [Paramecium pentaurelia]|uniref:Transmembrane protein n=1 Tax=Paramecium pentaurelia TaxID=43138 RepID=A0A8S1TGK6_9CILI|nr:unnamed protein product [Paramecium pentaurelia]
MIVIAHAEQKIIYLQRSSLFIKPVLQIPILIQAGDHSIYNNIRLFQLSYNILIGFNNDIDFNKDVEVIILNGQEEINIKQYDIFSDMNMIIIEYQQFISNSSKLKLNCQFFDIIQLKHKELWTQNQLYQPFSFQIQRWLQKKQIVTTKIADIIFVDVTTVEQVEMASSSNQYILYSIGTVSGTALLFGGLDIFYNLLDIRIQVFKINLFQFAYITMQYKYCHIQSILILNFLLIYKSFLLL